MIPTRAHVHSFCEQGKNNYGQIKHQNFFSCSDHIAESSFYPWFQSFHFTEAYQAEAILQGGQSDLICMARELMWNPNWPVHVAQTLGVPDYFDLLPPGYAWWLKRREATQQLNPDG